MTGFQAEDLFVVLIAKLIERIHKDKIEFHSNYLDDILREWLSEKTIQNELKENFKLDVSSEIAAGASFLALLKFKSALRAIFSSESNTSETIRQTIRRNPLRLIERFSAILYDLREALARENRAGDILFILDGTEKIPYDIYMQLFCRDSHLIRAIDANMIFSVPINAFFDIKGTPSSEFFQTHTLPMVRITEESIPFLEQVITRRIAADMFLEPDALRYCVEKSGGCIRQLIRIVNKSLIIGLGKKITKNIAEKSMTELRRGMVDQLDSEHLEILREKNYDTADVKVLDLLFSLAVLKYNGERRINPLIENMDFPND